MIGKRYNIQDDFEDFFSRPYFDEPASQLHKLHQELDKFVLRAYGFKAKDDILAKLLALNLELAEKEKNGEAVVGPWAVDRPPEKRKE